MARAVLGRGEHAYSVRRWRCCCLLEALACSVAVAERVSERVLNGARRPRDPPRRAWPPPTAVRTLAKSPFSPKPADTDTGHLELHKRRDESRLRSKRGVGKGEGVATLQGKKAANKEAREGFIRREGTSEGARKRRGGEAARQASGDTAYGAQHSERVRVRLAAGGSVFGHGRLERLPRRLLARRLELHPAGARGSISQRTGQRA